MPFVPIPDGVRIVLGWQIDQQVEANNVMHCQYSGVHDEAAMNIIASNVRAAFLGSPMLAYLHPNTSLISIEVTSIETATGPQSLLTQTDIDGTAAGAPLPNQVALVTTLRTAVRGRRGRGRIFFGGFAEDASLGNSPATACLDAVSVTVDDLRSGLVSSPLSVVSKLDGVARAVTDHEVGNIWDVQRRRKPNEVL